MTGTSLGQQIAAVWSLDTTARAIEFNERWYTWGELRDAALAIDKKLNDAGLGAGAAIGVMLRNRPALIAALLSLLTTERCIVSLNPLQPREGLHNDLRTLNLPGVIADEEDWAGEGTLALVQQQGCLAVSLPKATLASPTTVSSFNASLPHHESLPQTALEILTSGTTGTPKRIRISRRTMQDSIVDGATTGRTNPPPLALKHTPTLTFAPLLHVSGMFGVLLSIFEARPLVLLEKFSVQGWADAVMRHEIRFTSLPPTPMRMVLDANVPAEKLASLIAVRSGTAPLPPATQREFESRYGRPVLVQYGATEWMGGLAGWTLNDHKQFGAAKLGSVGRPRGDVRLRVVDPETAQEMPAGEPGILEVLPAQRLGASEWTRTTDLASIDADGFLYIHGRADDTIIRGGFKIQLNDVADVLMRHPSVLDVAVIGIPDERLGQVPVAAIELKPSVPSPSQAEWKTYAQQHLTPYKIPVVFKVVPALPRTVSMKVSRPDVKALFDAANDQRHG